MGHRATKIGGGSFIQTDRRVLHLFLEWMSLSLSLQRSKEEVQTKFCLCLQVLGLTLLEQYNNDTATRLLGLDSAGILTTFGGFEAGDLEDLAELGDDDIDLAYHCIALIRRLLETVGGEASPSQVALCGWIDSVEVNQRIYGAVVNVTGPASIMGVDVAKVREAMSRSSLMLGQELSLGTAQELLDVCYEVLRDDWVLVEDIG